jgi:hypothetical protein
MGCVLASMGCSEAPAAGADGGRSMRRRQPMRGALSTRRWPPTRGRRRRVRRDSIRGSAGPSGWATAPRRTRTRRPVRRRPAPSPSTSGTPRGTPRPAPAPTTRASFATPRASPTRPPRRRCTRAGTPWWCFRTGTRASRATRTSSCAGWPRRAGWPSRPDHVGNTLRDTPSPLPAAIFHLRARDASAALDALSAAPLRDALAGPIRTDRALLVGHSAGAHTTWAAAGATYDADAVAARCAGPNPCREGDREAFQMGQRDPTLRGRRAHGGHHSTRVVWPDGAPHRGRARAGP